MLASDDLAQLPILHHKHRKQTYLRVAAYVHLVSPSSTRSPPQPGFVGRLQEDR